MATLLLFLWRHFGYTAPQQDLGRDRALVAPLYICVCLSIYAPIDLSVHLPVHLYMYTYK